jgi:hypothetical protein
MKPMASRILRSVKRFRWCSHCRSWGAAVLPVTAMAIAAVERGMSAVSTGICR